MSRETDEILRFKASERHLHWAIAVPFKVCYLTALVLVAVYNPAPHRPLREVVSWIHRVSGICLAVLPPVTIAWHWRDFRVHLRNVRAAWSWSLDDLKWLALMGPAALTSRVSLPPQGKFNAAEKINFMYLTASYPGYVLTGATILFLGTPYISWLLHFGLAMAATPLLLGHVFMATVNPASRVGLTGMLTGMVDREWAKHHYAKWYAEQAGSAVKPRPSGVPAVVFLPSAARAHARAGSSPAPAPTPGAAAQNPGARNLESGTRNLVPGTRNLEPGTRNLVPGTGNSELGTESRGMPAKAQPVQAPPGQAPAARGAARVGSPSFAS